MMKYDITLSRLLYIYTIDDNKHRGLLKVGEVFVPDDIAKQADKSLQMGAVREKLKARQYAQSLKYHLEYVECTTYDDMHCYNAQKVHDCLHNSGVQSKMLGKWKRQDADIWFQTDIDTVRCAIEAVKQGKKTFNNTDDQVKPRQIVFRPEQEKAIADTVAHFSKKSVKNGANGKRYLWNAKMRFGKTLSGLEVARRMQYQFVLIVTHRPVVDKGWGEDFDKIFAGTSGYYYASRMDTDEAADAHKRPNHIQNITDSQFLNMTKDVKEGKKKGMVMFVSMQYLRLSTLVGGKNTDEFKKNIMEFPWQLVMIDEAHEGTESTMGKRVIDKLTKDDTHVLSLSGTPFNLLDQYEDGEIYTWDYVMEQNAKHVWDNEHYGDPNPYADLPNMQILTFTLSKMLRSKLKDNSGVFKFHEFFRVFTGDMKEDGRAMEADEKVGDFVYKKEIIAFLDRLSDTSDTSEYPFSTNEFRKSFRHTFWLLPYVKEAKAMEKLLNNHKIFKNFKIINVAGDGNMEDPNGSALKEVQDAIHAHKHTITLSCGKLTTGVSVPEWTAVLCMKGSEDTPAANYMQTIFRVQTHAVLEGRQKSKCFVFDFAPDRALTAVAETAKMQVLAASTSKKDKAFKQTQKEEEQHLESFLQLCPVISMDGGQMGHHFSANDLFVKLNDVYIERAVRSGYSDNSLYNVDALLNLTPDQEQALEDVHSIVGSMPNTWKPDPITVNGQGFSGTEDAKAVQYVYMMTADVIAPDRPVPSANVFANGAPVPTDEDWREKMGKLTTMWPYCYVSHSVLKDGVWGEYTMPVLWKEYKDTTSETDEAKKEKAKQNKEKQARMSVLRGVSIRIPLLVYGAELNDEEDEITIDNFADLVDQASWNEYMPTGFTKKTFNKLKDCFDRSIFTGAARRIRQMVKAADTMNIEDRINQIAKIFHCFHNPDKETVLTPWRVVNMQLSDTLGGWCFYNDRFDDYYKEENEFCEMVNSVRFVNHGKVTEEVFGDYYARILEVNSKTGLYPLYMAYSIFKCAKEKAFRGEGLTGERGKTDDREKYGKQVVDDQEIWEDVLQDNIFVVCRTKMAASITRRTLAGFRRVRMNIECYKQKLDVTDLVKSGLIRKDDSYLSQEGKVYYYQGKKTLPCDMIDVLRTKPELFQEDVVMGRDFWHVYNSIPIRSEEDINNMKFTAVVGNPPYQLTVAKKDSENGQKPVLSIFQHFQASGDKIAKYTSLIYPGARWIHRAGKGLAQFGLEQINDLHLARLEYFPDASDIFEKVGISDGLSIVFKDMEKKENGFQYVYSKNGISYEIHADNPGEELMPLNPYDITIVNKINEFVFGKYEFLHDSIFPRTLFSIESDFVEKNPTLVRPYIDGEAFNFDSEVKLFTNDKAGKAGRATWFVASKDVISTGKQYLNQWKVVVSSANAGGQKRSNQLAIIDNHSAFGRSRVALKIFKTEREAINFYKYVKSELIRFAFLLTEESLSSLGKLVPDLLNYKDDNGVIDFNADINEQLYKLFDIDEDNQKHIQAVLATKAD